jgi:hypothetical protein
VDDLFEENRRAVIFFDSGDPITAAKVLEPIEEHLEAERRVAAGA